MRQWGLLCLLAVAAGDLKGQAGITLTASMPIPVPGIRGNSYGAIFGQGGLVSIPLTARFTASGGTAPYTYTIKSGLLPPGLLLNPGTGVIEGYPTGGNGLPVVVQAQDSQGRTATYNWNAIRVERPPEFFFQAMVGSSFRQQTPTCGLAGGTGFKYQASLPPGFELVTGATNGVVGVPDEEGQFDGRYACDNGAVRFEWLFRLRVDPMPVYYLPTVKEGTYFAHNPAEFPETALGALYQIVSGRTPDGVSLSDPALGRVDGEPERPGNFTWQLRRSLQDASFRTHRYVLLVNADPEKDPDRLTVNRNQVTFQVTEGQEEPLVGAFLVRAGKRKLIRVKLDSVIGGNDRVRHGDVRVTPADTAFTDAVVELRIDVSRLRGGDRAYVNAKVSRRESDPPFDWLEPELTLTVEIQVESKAPKLEVTPAQLSWRFIQNETYISGSPARGVASFRVKNAGGGELKYTLSEIKGGGDWIGLYQIPNSYTLGPEEMATASLQVKPYGLPLGTYYAELHVTAPDQPTHVVEITLLIVPRKGALIEGDLEPLVMLNGPPRTETYRITFPDARPGDEWRVSLMQEEETPWLKLTGGHGSSGQSFQLTFDPAPFRGPNCKICGYAPMAYLRVDLFQGGTYRPPGWMSVQMKLLAYARPYLEKYYMFLPSRTQDGPGPEPATNIMVNLNPSEQAFRTFEYYWPGNPTRQRFLSVEPKEGTMGAGDLDFYSTKGVEVLTLGSAPERLEMPGFYLSDVTVRFRDLGGASEIEHPVTFRVGQLVGRTGDPVPPTPRLARVSGAAKDAGVGSSDSRGARGASERMAGECGTGQLLVLTAMEPMFRIPAGVPRELKAQVLDGCAEPVQEGLVTARFSNGDPAVALNHQGEGLWTALWIPRTEADVVRLTVEAWIDETTHGQDEISGSVLDEGRGPLLDAQGVRHGASRRALAVLAPGMLVRLHGRRLTVSSGASAVAGTTAPVLAGTRVMLGDTPLDLLEVTPTEILARIPEDAVVGEDIALMVRYTDGGAALVGEFPLVPASPGVLTFDGTGTGQGLIHRLRGTQRVLAVGSQGALGDELVAIEVTGLGIAKQPGMEEAPLRVLLGDDELAVVPERVSATPGKPGVADVVFRMPANRPVGPAVQVRVEAAGFRSSPVTMSIEPDVQ